MCSDVDLGMIRRLSRVLGLEVWNGTSRLRNIRWLSTGRTAPSIYSYILERYTHVNNLLFTPILLISQYFQAALIYSLVTRVMEQQTGVGLEGARTSTNIYAA